MPLVDSTAVERVDYTDSSRTLDIWFRGGGHYRYIGVPAPVYEALLAAASIGAFVNLHIKDHYACKEVSARRRFRPGDQH
jgi:hypothetical protein